MKEMNNIQKINMMKVCKLLIVITLFKKERSKTIPCPAACPLIGHIREYPQDYPLLLDEKL